MTLLRRHRDYRLLLLAGLVSLTGDWVLDVGLAYLVYALTGSTLASGATVACALLPQLVLGSVAGVLVDRWDRRATMVRCDLLQVVGLAPLLLVGPGRIWPVYAVAFWQGCLTQFFTPSQQALVPSLVPGDELFAANALNGQVQNVARLGGSALGGVLAAWGGLRAVAAFDAASFVASAALVSLVVAPPRVAVPPEVAGVVRRLLAEWREGLAIVWRSRGLRTLLAVALVTSVGEGVMATLFAPWVRDVVHGDGRAFGLIVGVQAVGGVTGGFVATAIGGRYPAWLLASVGAMVFGLLDLTLFLYPLAYPHVGPALVLMALVGLPAAVAVTGYLTIVQTLTEDRYRGRVIGAVAAVRGLAVLAGTGAAAFLGERLGILPVIAYQGVGYVLGGAIAYAGLRPVKRTSPVDSHHSHATSSASSGNASR